MPVSEVLHFKKLCIHHGSILKLYCESCEEPICTECQIIGPHNTKLHRLSGIVDSFKRKYNLLSNMINKNLLNKLDILTSNIQKIESNIEEVKTVKGNIERDIRTEYTGILDQLKSEEGKKLAVLQFESSLLTNEINHIEDLIQSIGEVDQNNKPDMIEFLLKYNQLKEAVEMNITKPIRGRLLYFIYRGG